MESDWREQFQSEAEKFYKENCEKSRYMFGYPSYHYPVSDFTKALLMMHYSSPFSNNCGDIDERGNYAMDTKEMEKRIVGLYAEKFGMGDEFWGYVTSGGSESNSCGITSAFSKNPNGVLYYSASAHYSVEKYAERYPRVKIPTVENDVMDMEILKSEIEKNHLKNGAAANLVLTHGTTKYGACDDVDEIVTFLKEKNIPYYIHLDAALFGGIQNNQEDAPVIVNAKARGIDSVCVSMHKYLGFPDVKSVYVAVEKPRGKEIAYIGQHDTTVSGSRSIPAYALYNHIVEHSQEKQTDKYVKNVRFFEELLKASNVEFYRAEKSNIFVMDCPSELLCRQYQLSCFDEDTNGNPQKAHVIIFPSHGEKEMQELAQSLKEELGK